MAAKAMNGMCVFYLWKLKKHVFDEQESVGLKKKISKTYNFWKVLINIGKLILHCFILNQVGMDEAEVWMMSYICLKRLGCNSHHLKCLGVSGVVNTSCMMPTPPNDMSGFLSGQQDIIFTWEPLRSHSNLCSPFLCASISP